MVDQHGSVIHLVNPVNVTRISIAGIVDRVFKLKVSFNIIIMFFLRSYNFKIFLALSFDSHISVI